jgi:hypothetical protein
MADRAKEPGKPHLQPEQEEDDELLDEANPAIIEISLEDYEAELQRQARDAELDEEGPVDTQHGDGSAYDPFMAEVQGLVYIPPDDPPVIPSDRPEQIEIAAGFGKAIEEEDDPREEVLPDHVINNDSDLEEKIRAALRKNSETTTLTEIDVTVEDGIVYLSGQVETLDDVDLVVTVVRDLEGVVDVEEDLEVALI